MYNREYYQNKANRDERADDLKKRGFAFKKRSSRNQVFNPSHVEDFFGQTYGNGFGGTADQFFSCLYILEF